MEQVVRAFKRSPYKPAGKTGTAQTVYGGESDIGRNDKAIVKNAII